jgi:hypothetical protein
LKTVETPRQVTRRFLVLLMVHMSKEQFTHGRNALTLLLFVVGTLLSIVSLGAEILGLDLTPGFGMVQMFQLLLGLTFLTAAGFLHIYNLRPAHAPRSLQADIGIRLALTGLVFTYVAGLADLVGIGTHIEPRFIRPYVGPLQLGGILLGIISITAGMLLFYTSRGSQSDGKPSSLQSLLGWKQETEN